MEDGGGRHVGAPAEVMDETASPTNTQSAQPAIRLPADSSAVRPECETTRNNENSILSIGFSEIIQYEIKRVDNEKVTSNGIKAISDVRNGNESFTVLKHPEGCESNHMDESVVRRNGATCSVVVDISDPKAVSGDGLAPSTKGGSATGGDCALLGAGGGGGAQGRAPAASGGGGKGARTPPAVPAKPRRLHPPPPPPPPPPASRPQPAAPAAACESPSTSPGAARQTQESSHPRPPPSPPPPPPPGDKIAGRDASPEETDPSEDAEGGSQRADAVEGGPAHEDAGRSSCEDSEHEDREGAAAMDAARRPRAGQRSTKPVIVEEHRKAAASDHSLSLNRAPHESDDLAVQHVAIRTSKSAEILCVAATGREGSTTEVCSPTTNGATERRHCSLEEVSLLEEPLQTVVPESRFVTRNDELRNGVASKKSLEELPIPEVSRRSRLSVASQESSTDEGYDAGPHRKQNLQEAETTGSPDVKAQERACPAEADASAPSLEQRGVTKSHRSSSDDSKIEKMAGASEKGVGNSASLGTVSSASCNGSNAIQKAMETTACDDASAIEKAPAAIYNGANDIENALESRTRSAVSNGIEESVKIPADDVASSRSIEEAVERIFAGAEEEAVAAASRCSRGAAAVALGEEEAAALGEVLHEAVAQRDAQRVAELLARGANPDAPDWRAAGEPPLLRAAANGDLRCVRALVAGGCCANARSAQGETALHLAARLRGGAAPDEEGGGAALVRLLLAAGCDARLQCSLQGCSALHVLCRRGPGPRDAAALRALAGAAPGVADLRDHRSRTALHRLVDAGVAHAQLYEELLLAGADASLQDARGETPLLAALQRGGAPAGGVVALLAPHTDLARATAYGETALHIAARTDRPDLVRLLLQHGAPAGARDLRGNTALHLAAGRGFARVAALLLAAPDAHAPHAVNAANDDGCTPLHVAVDSGFVPVVKLLLEIPECDLHARTQLGQTPLDLAQEEYRRRSTPQMALILLQAINKRQETSSTYS